MPSTYLSLNYHLIFSTKRRAANIAEPWRERLHDYMGGTIRGLDGISRGVGGVADHVHLLIGLKATHCLADVLRELKKASSTWIHEEIGVKDFAWQEGYAALTVSPTSCEAIQQYIDNQEAHHRQQTSREELLEILRRAGIDYDPQYFD